MKKYEVTFDRRSSGITSSVHKLIKYHRTTWLLTEEINKWLDDHVKHCVYFSSYASTNGHIVFYKAVFDDTSDALLFKLAWGNRCPRS